MKHFRKLLFYVVCLFPLWSMAQSTIVKKEELKLRGDFTLIGNTVVRHSLEKEEETDNGNVLSKYVDVDDVSTTKNSSSATLVLRNDEGEDISIDDCTKIKYARLYWYGRVDDCWNQNNEKEKRKSVMIRYGSEAYKTYTSAELYELKDTGPTVVAPNLTREVYTAYADVTDLVKSKGAGKYTVANVETMSSEDTGGGNRLPVFPTSGFFYLYDDANKNIYYTFKPAPPATVENRMGVWDDLKNYVVGTGTKVGTGVYGGATYNIIRYNYSVPNTPQAVNEFYDIIRKVQGQDCSKSYARADGLGYFGGWSLVVVYENELMSPKAVSIFDGLEKITRETGAKDIVVSGFSTPRTGRVDGKLGFAVLEGDYKIEGDYMVASNNPITNTTNTFVRRPGSNFKNVFDGNVTRISSDERDPYLEVNYGVDMDVLNKTQLPQGIIKNSQDTFYMRFATTGDAYYPNLFVTSFTNYIPDPVGVGSYAGPTTVQLNPGDKADFRIDFYNMGNEEIIDGKVYLPIPRNVDFELVSFTATAGTAKKVKGNIPPSQGQPERVVPNGYIVWEVGRELPTTSDRQNPRPLASLTYTIRIAKDCDKLRTLCSSSPTEVTISGFVRGQGKYSGDFIPDVSIINKKGLSTNKCLNLPEPEQDNSVQITRDNGQLKCDYNPDKERIKFCVNDSYENGLPAGNLEYNDALQAGEYIQYNWDTYKAIKARVNRDADGRIINLGTGFSFVQIIPGITSGSWSTKEGAADNYGPGIMYKRPGGAVTLQRPAYNAATEELYIRIRAVKRNASGVEIGGCRQTDFVPIQILDAPVNVLTPTLSPGTPLCAADGEITFTSPNNQSIESQRDPVTGVEIQGLTYSVRYKFYKQGATQKEKDNAPILTADLDGNGKAVIKLNNLSEGNYTYETIGITNGTCSTDVPTTTHVSIKAQAPESKITSDGKSFTIEPNKETGVRVKYKLQRKVVTIDNNKITNQEWKDIKISGLAYTYETDEKIITETTPVSVPRLQGEYRVVVTTEFTASGNTCKRVQDDFITVDKSLRFHYINPNLRNRASRN